MQNQLVGKQNKYAKLIEEQKKIMARYQKKMPKRRKINLSELLSKLE
jgi:hypothetical protein